MYYISLGWWYCKAILHYLSKIIATKDWKKGESHIFMKSKKEHLAS